MKLPPRRWLLGGAGAAALISLWWGVPAILRRMDVFRVRRLEVSGARFLTAAEVARTAAIPARANLFDDLEPARRRVLALPGVESVKLHRRIPGAVEFEITEFEPVALVPGPRGLALVDRRGRVLPFDPTRNPMNLPLAPADSAVTALVDRVRDADAELYATVNTAERERGTIVLTTARHRLLFRVGATTKDILGARAVVDELERHRLVVSEIDARFAGRVIVRGRGA